MAIARRETAALPRAGRGLTGSALRRSRAATPRVALRRRRAASQRQARDRQAARDVEVRDVGQREPARGRYQWKTLL